MADGAAFVSDVARLCMVTRFIVGLARWRMCGYIGVRVREWWSTIMISWRPKLSSGKFVCVNGQGRCPGQF